MPRAPLVSAQKLIRVLKKLGFSEHAERATSNLVFSHPDAVVFIDIGSHDDVY
ncbi:MAG: type II toxin-antitoxin system HicA family toxin [Minisyncoccota bacterium]